MSVEAGWCVAWGCDIVLLMACRIAVASEQTEQNFMLMAWQGSNRDATADMCLTKLFHSQRYSQGNVKMALQ